ncbi:MAG: chromate transporter [Candidatus Faecivicinus sp.]
MIYLQLFLSFLQVGLFSIGGGYAAMPLIQSQVVSAHGWLTMNEFTDLITIAEMTPGPIAVNAATFVGVRIAGPGGAVVATLACILPSCFIVSLLAFIYFRYKRLSALQSVLASLRPAVVALIAAAGLSILRLVVFGDRGASLQSVDWIGIAIFAAAFVLLRKMKWNPIWVMALCGCARLGLGWAAGI